MANKVKFTKRGMGGSLNGRGRTDKTEVMKRHSKKLRRNEGKQEITGELEKDIKTVDESERTNMAIVISTSNRHFSYQVVLKDFTLIYPDFVDAGKLAFYEKHFSRTPYWVQVFFDDEAGTVLQREFATEEEAWPVVHELAGCKTMPEFSETEGWG